ncbi:uncharacterized protein LOC121239089 isoform X1 [Juglans microcarpa x Juglans regia]|uniref:uncharacterized protein LOC121239089 isoform X1 n=1 Tax=Juglans microcarpa x Juglans regia TaxID=2249226 RepID=UPI001B7F5F7B|nr:uncharacterized protein LOC121239089 isoform X1 [Juglans microcarpa x Juglans regia]
MATLEGHHVDAGSESRCHYRHSATGSSGMSLSGDSDDQSWHSPLEIEGVSESQRDSSESDCLCEKDLESGVLEVKVHLGKVERDCRICHLGLEDDIEPGVPIELGCACKGDLGAAHKQCAETWFKIKGNACRQLPIVIMVTCNGSKRGCRHNKKHPIESLLHFSSEGGVCCRKVKRPRLVWKLLEPARFVVPLHSTLLVSRETRQTMLLLLQPPPQHLQHP